MDFTLTFFIQRCVRSGSRLAALAAVGIVGALSAYAQNSAGDQNLNPEWGGTGSVKGSVIDSATGSPVPSVAVVLEWPEAEARELADEVTRKKTMITDEDGGYSIGGLPAGTYNLKLVKIGFEVGSLRGVKVEEGQETEANYAMIPKKAEMSEDIFDMDSFEVTAEGYGDGGQAWLSDLKQDSAGSIDFLSIEDFAKFGGSDLSDIVQRMPGVIVVEGQFAVVRGLGDRYNSTLVNGLPVPSPDPVRQGLQLDLFPTSIMESVITQKSFLPDMPSNSSGAGFNLLTKSYPEETTVFFKGGVRINSNAQDTYLKNPDTGFDDLLADGASSRPPPSQSGSSASILASTSRNVVPVKANAPMGLSFEAGAGGTTEIGGRKLGLVFAATYNSSYDTQTGWNQDRYATNSTYFIVPPGFPGPTIFGNPGSLFEKDLWASALHYDMTQSESEVLIGVLAGVGYELDKEGDNRIDFTFLMSQSGSSFVQTAENGYLPAGYSRGTTGSDQTDRGFGDPTAGGVSANIKGRDGNNSLTVDTNTISYEQRELYVYQLEGTHEFDEADDLRMDWGATFSNTTSQTPHETVTNYLYDDGSAGLPAGYFYDRANAIGSAEPFLTETWRNIAEDLYGARLDLQYDWEDPYSDYLSGMLASGIFWNTSHRNTDQVDTVIYGTTSGTRYEDQQGVVDDILSDTNSTASVMNSYAINNRDELAGYLAMDINITDSFKITGGGRFGNLAITSKGDSNYSPTQTLADVLNQPTLGNINVRNGALLGFQTATNDNVSKALIQRQLNEGGNINRTYALPAVTFTYEVTDEITIRGGYSQTIAQPSFRELSPYFSRELGTGEMVVGNPLLELSDVDSLDLRVEYRFRPGSIVSLSPFYKQIQNPIEQIVIYDAASDQSILSYFNNENTAIVKGIEFDFQTSLDFIAEELEYFSFGTNFTYIDAQVAYSNQVMQTYFRQQGSGVSGPFVGDEGPPLGNNNLPTKRRLFDQPEYIANGNITYNNPDWGSAVTLSVFAQSEVLSAVGAGTDNSVDQFTGAYYQLDLTYSQQITENLQFSFRVTNITDTPRTIVYSQELVDGGIERQSYKLGQTYSLSLKYTF